MAIKDIIHDMMWRKSHRVVGDAAVHDAAAGSSALCCWANLPLELLREILAKIEAADSAWPSRRSVVACAGVCRSWRQITKEIVKVPELSGYLTFPISVKQLLSSVQTPDQILAQNSELYLGKSGGCLPAINSSNQFQADNTPRSQSSTVELTSKYLPKAYSFAGNTGKLLGTMQQPNGRVPVV